MENIEKIQGVQEEIKKMLKTYHLAFPCPHCEKEINDNHFSKEQRIFQFINEKIREIVEEQFALRSNAYKQNWLEEIEKSRIYESFAAIKNLRKSTESLQTQVTKFQSSEYIESLVRVKKLKEELAKYKKESEELREKNQNLLLVQKRSGQEKGKEFEKWFLEELRKVFDDRDNIIDVSKGQAGMGKRADFLQEIFTETEPKKSVGRIIYETKNTEKWNNGWIIKLEEDMRTHQAEYGFIVATCENDKVIRPVDLRKKIYISGDNNNLFVVAKIMRELLIAKHNFTEMINSNVKEQRIKNLERWVSDKLPRYVSSLEEEFESQEKEANSIINKVEKIRNSKEKIRKLTIDKIILEIKDV